ncbi:MAG TPA: type II toxin-antitoxin system RatA family toxin [Casimicrobiaceae bacterium]|nr:type II toxin-antitoxin system RatA family toxin [Casimicrobiaceae bacterium]
MASVEKSVLVPYRAQQMFALVERVEDYPGFLPWCAGATILERSEDETIARLDINYRGVRAHFTTANRIERPERIVIALRSGPFRRLEGTWRFTALGDIGSKVELTMAYEFATAALARLIGPVFGRIAHTFVDAFVRRAEEIHGDASAGPLGGA